MDHNKVCKKCAIPLPLSAFYKNRDGKLGVRSSCKACDNTLHGHKRRQWRAKNYAADIERQRAYRAAHPELVTAMSALRHATKLRATPTWLTRADLAEIGGVYQFAQVMTRLSGEQYHVDHDVPLRGEGVRGLHVPWNLVALPARENLLKSNKLSSVA